MKVSDVIRIVAEEKPHSFSDEKILSWINEVEAEVQEQLGVSPFIPAEDEDSKLFAKTPYDRLYVSYVKAKVDYALEEYASYENNQAQHIADFRDFSSWVLRTSQAANRVTKIKGVY